MRCSADLQRSDCSAGCLRYHAGLFHLVFMCNDTHSAYYYTAEKAQGP